MSKNIVLLENIRSAYNVWNIIRTADALWWDVWLSGYTPHPLEQPKVIKTSLWAEENVGLERFYHSQDAIKKAKKLNSFVIAWELDDKAIPLDEFSDSAEKIQNILIILWNEVDGVLDFTLNAVDRIVYIPMSWIKESMNVGQAAAIFMWHLRK